MRSVSVIGLGAMGSALARTLLKGFDRVTVWNRTIGKARDLEREGAMVAATPAEAILSSDVTITCIRSHGDTATLLGRDPSVLTGKTIIELSTGDVSAAERLMDQIGACGGDCLIGMIAVFPKDIGSPDSAILVVGLERVWQAAAPVLKSLAGASAHVGESPKVLAAIYASLVLPRQGFMFGMIYGAAVCRRAGIPMETYVDMLPLTMRIVSDYFDLFAETVPNEQFDDPPASLAVYHAAFEDVLRTCRDLGAPDDLPRLLRDHLKVGMDAGLADKQITSLVRHLDLIRPR